jgi:CNT family concentrative nucleoside transporter
MSDSCSASVPAAPRTPWSWRLAIVASILAIGGTAFLLRDIVGPRGQALAGVFCFFGVVAACSANLRAVNWRTIVWGVVLQVALALLVLKVPQVNEGFNAVKVVVLRFIDFSNAGAEFVFGNLARPGDLALNPGKEFLFIFAFKALPPVLFISAFFTLLYHYGILQRLVRLMAAAMVHLMRTSGAETLSVSANVFMGMTESPLIVKPYVPRMTQSELFALMASGMAHISGGMMVVYINYGADPVAVLTTCIMACRAASTWRALHARGRRAGDRRHRAHLAGKTPYVNGIDALTGGAGDGMRLAINIVAMLIVFIAVVAMLDAVIGFFARALAPEDLRLGILARGVPDGYRAGGCGEGRQPARREAGDHEHYAYLVMKGWRATADYMDAARFVHARRFRAHRFCQLCLRRHPARRHRRHRARAPARSGEARTALSLRRLRRHAAQRLHRRRAAAVGRLTPPVCRPVPPGACAWAWPAGAARRRSQEQSAGGESSAWPGRSRSSTSAGSVGRIGAGRSMSASGWVGGVDEEGVAVRDVGTRRRARSRTPSSGRCEGAVPAGETDPRGCETLGFLGRVGRYGVPPGVDVSRGIRETLHDSCPGMESATLGCRASTLALRSRGFVPWEADSCRAVPTTRGNTSGLHGQ